MTGDALVGANVLNLANQNIIGRNWLTAIVNVFGDFNGNIAFGRPDLWVGERIEAPAQVVNGSDLVFHFTVTNKGDAPATQASFRAVLDTAHLAFTDGVTKDLGTLDPGQSTEVVVHAKVNAPAGTSIDTSGTASEHETDNNAADNTDRVSIAVGPFGGGGGRSSHASSGPTAAADLSVARRTIAAVVNGAHRTVHEELVVTNPTDATSTPVDLHDLLKNPDGTVIHDQAWPLDTLAPHEEVTVTYDLTFEKGTPVGWYPLSSVLASAAGDTERKDNGSIFVLASALVSGQGHVTGTGAGLVRGVSTSTPEARPTASPLLAAAGLAGTPWSYALGFALAAGLLAGFLWAAAALRRRTLGS